MKNIIYIKLIFNLIKKMSYHKTLSFYTREKESKNIIEQNPNKVPIICLKDPKSNLTETKKTKYLLDKNFTISQFTALIKTKLKLNSNEALFLVAKKGNKSNALAGDVPMSQVYEEFKEKDGFLYIFYTSKEIWGN